MDAFSSPLRLVPSLTPRRAPSPTMSPGGRRGRTHGSSEETRLRDLSPGTTLRAFTQKPMPFDTTCDEYKIFACIEALTAAERDLGARVAKAAQRLKCWCVEIEQWGWTGSFAQPSDEYRERRRRSIEMRIREHVAEADLTTALPPLEYWGSLLSVEVEQHEARLDDIEEEMLKLDVEELKEHVLDMHPTGKSRPSSAGFEATRENYKLMDDFSFLITQTLLSALPDHAQLKERLSTWTARVSILREAPRYMEELKVAQKAMKLGWDAIEPPADTSDMAFAQWREAVDTISGVLQGKINDLGRRLDRMLDTLEGREDCLPDNWIDIFESTEADYGRWAHESRRKVIDFDLRRKVDKGAAPCQVVTEQLVSHSDGAAALGVLFNHALKSIVHTDVTSIDHESTFTAGLIDHAPVKSAFQAKKSDPIGSTDFGLRSVTALKTGTAKTPSNFLDVEAKEGRRDHAKSCPEMLNHKTAEPPLTSLTFSGTDIAHDVSNIPVSPFRSHQQRVTLETESEVFQEYGKPHLLKEYEVDLLEVDATPMPKTHTVSNGLANQVRSFHPQKVTVETFSPTPSDGSDFDEGDTVVHNDLDDSPENDRQVQSTSQSSLPSQTKVPEQSVGITRTRSKPPRLTDSTPVITHDGQYSAETEPPQTPRSRRGSVGSLSSELSFDSSSPGNIEESPSVRNATNRAVRAPRPELNAAMAKRRPVKAPSNDSVGNAPWPPSRFTQKPANSADDLERKISDILTTIPAHIRLTSGPGADAPEVKSMRSVANKGSRGYLRAARSASGLKSPELTLSPAKTDDSANAASGRKSAATLRGDNDIKLYHLTQPGKEHPIKLFIRRVGENGERVMVRVGGGWADLGEYLRQYAEHHGRRTASDGKFEILGLEVKNTDNSPNRPESVLSRRDRRFSGGLPLTSPATTPIKASGLSNSVDKAPPPMPSLTPTPGIAEESSVPSTNSSQRSWQGNEAGLAGPKSKKLDLSGDKLEWIEGMMKQARTVSGNVITANHLPAQRDDRAESRSESRSDSRTTTRKPDFGDLGKVGGTKRIFLRGGQPSMSEQ